MPTQNLLRLLLLMTDVDSDSFVQIWMLKFGHKGIKLNFCLDIERKVWSKLKLRRDFEAEVWSLFCC